jgi:hypothetical protein
MFISLSLDHSTVQLVSEEYKLWSSLLWSVLHPPVTWSLFVWIFFWAPVAILVLCSSRNFRDQVWRPHGTTSKNWVFFFLDFTNLFAICRDTFSKWCVGRRGRVEECSVAPLCNKRVNTLCGCREERVQIKVKYKLRLTTKAYKLSYNYINCTIYLVGRSFGKCRRSRSRSGCSRRVRRMSFGCAVRLALYWLISFLTDGIWRSLRIRVFGTYYGASTIMRRAFDWKRSRISMLDVEAVPQSWIP